MERTSQDSGGGKKKSTVLAFTKSQLLLNPKCDLPK